MPTSGKDKPWYSIEQASVHFTIISTEHDWSENSEQVRWNKLFYYYPSCLIGIYLMFVYLLHMTV